MVAYQSFGDFRKATFGSGGKFQSRPYSANRSRMRGKFQMRNRAASPMAIRREPALKIQHGRARGWIAEYHIRVGAERDDFCADRSGAIRDQLVHHRWAQKSNSECRFSPAANSIDCANLSGTIQWNGERTRPRGRCCAPSRNTSERWQATPLGASPRPPFDRRGRRSKSAQFRSSGPGLLLAIVHIEIVNRAPLCSHVSNRYPAHTWGLETLWPHSDERMVVGQNQFTRRQFRCA